MSAYELKRDYNTRYCLFSIESKNDVAMLPTSKTKGRGDLAESTPCCQGSIAKSIDGSAYVLNSDDEWVLVNEKRESSAQTLSIVRGTTMSIIIAIDQVNGEEYTMANDDTLRFCVKRNASDSDYVINKEITNASSKDGGYELVLSPEDTENLDVGRYYYDVGLQIGGEYFMIIETSIFNVTQNISAREV